jgi:hypothetical protein
VTEPSNINLDLLKKQNAELLRQVEESKRGGGGSGSHRPPMTPPDERIGKIEGQIEGLKHGQNLHLAALAGSFATVLVAVGIVFAILLSLWNKVDQQGDQIVQLPSKISSDLRDITRTLAEAITASKQAPTQVIMVPAPVPPPMPPSRP